MQSRGGLARHDRLVWAAVLPLLLYLTLTGAGATYGVFVTPFRVVSLAILCLLFTAWAIAAWTHRGARPTTTLGTPIVLVLVAMAASTVASSDPRAGAEFVAYGVILAALYALLVLLMGRPGFARRIVVVLTGATLALAIGYIVTVVVAWTEWWGLLGRLAVPPTRPAYAGLTYEAPGIFTAFLVTAAASCVAFLASGGQRDRRVAVVLVALVGVAVVLAGARGGWLGIGVAVVVTGLAALLTGGRFVVPRSTAARAALGVSAVAAIAGLIAIGPAILLRLTSGGGEELRLTFAAVSIRIFREHPLLGSGPGTWGPLRASHTLAGEIDYYIPHAHNVPLQTLAETGIVGVLVGVVLVVAVLRLVVPAIRSGDTTRRAIGLGALFVGTYLLAHQLVDFFMDDPAILFAAALPIAALDANARRVAGASAGDRRESRWRSGRLGSLVPVAALCVSLLLVFRIEVPALIASRALDLVVAGNDGQALQQVSDALSGDPGQTSYLWVQALEAARTGDLALARANFRTVGEHDDLPQAWLNLAALDLEAGDTAAAELDLARALRLGIQQPAVALPAAALWLRLGNEPNAVEAAIATLSGAPSLTDDPWWTSSADLAGVRGSAVARILASGDSSTAWQVAMYAGDLASARAAASQLPEGEQGLAASVIDAWEGRTGAVSALAALAQAAPGGGAPQWAARVAARDGDEDATVRFRRLAELGSAAAGTDLGYDTVVTDHLDRAAQVPGAPANYHFHHVYRRSVPWDMLVDTLPKLTMQ